MPKAAELNRGDHFDGFFHVRDSQERVTRSGKTYLDLTLEDSTGSIPSKVWEIETQLLGEVGRGDFVKVRATAEDYQGNLQLRVHKIRRVNDEDFVEGFRPEDCLEQTPFDIDSMWEEIREIAKSAHPNVAEFLVSVFDLYEEQFRQWPAAQRIHHSYLGGLLEHTLSVTKTCLYLTEKYQVSRDLLLAGALTHDIGKIHELSTKGGIFYTDQGRLIGHLVLGRDIVRDHAQKVSTLPEDFLLHLEHLILAHQGQLEWGTVKVPMTPEALLLHYADDIDAKFNIAIRTIEQDRGDENFTSRNAIMQRPFYKPRPVLPQVDLEEAEKESTPSEPIKKENESDLENY